MFSGCIPAHAAYFSIFEYVKKSTGANLPGHHPLAAGTAGACATLAHDCIITPMDVAKQRLQLGYYKGIKDCFQTVLRTEGIGAFYLSLPTTLLMNLPYGMVMVATNESLKKLLNPSNEQNIPAFMVAGAGAGAVAAAVTNPLDVVKTRLQTQILVHMPPGPSELRPGGALNLSMTNVSSTASNPHAMGRVEISSVKAPSMSTKPQVYTGLFNGFRQIIRDEGTSALFRGIGPRLAVHSPAVAVSWTTYESIKRFLAG